MGDLVLRRRLEPTLQVDVYEVKLGEEYLMSSLFTASEVELGRLGLAALSSVAGDGDGGTDGAGFDVVVGGLGLGYTARAVLEDPRVRSLYVVDALGEVIDWHRQHLLPLSAELTEDPRCHLVHGDFFALVAEGAPFGPTAPERLHAVLVDIDHTPRHHLDPSHAAFYEPDGLRRMADRLHPGGIFGLWSDAPPDADYIATAEQVFTTCEARVVTFPNPHSGEESRSTVYLAVAR